MEEEKGNLIIQIDEKPKLGLWVFLSIQHVFAMFGATILVPILTGLPVSVALFASGIGTLTYTFFTKAKVPVYLGSSFAYIMAVQLAVESLGGDIGAAQTGLMLVGLIYVIIALVIKVTGKQWIDRLLPPIVIGPMIAVIGLGLASNAITNAQFVEGGDPKAIAVAVITFFVAAFISTKAKGFLKIVPFLAAICIGYIVSLFFGLVDFQPVLDASIFSIPEFAFPFALGNFNQYTLYFGPEAIAILPVALVTLSEHIGDHTVLGKICGKDFLNDPGLDNTLIGDGVATMVSAFFGGPANTTYGENLGVIGMTKIGSIYVTCGAAVMAIILSFFGTITALINSIPDPVLGGMSILLYGAIASSGLRVLVDSGVDFGKQKNLVIASAMLVIGLGGAVFPLWGAATLSGTALAAIAGIILNVILPDEE